MSRAGGAGSRSVSGIGRGLGLGRCASRRAFPDHRFRPRTPPAQGEDDGERCGQRHAQPTEGHGAPGLTLKPSTSSDQWTVRPGRRGEARATQDETPAGADEPAREADEVGEGTLGADAALRRARGLREADREAHPRDRLAGQRVEQGQAEAGHPVARGEAGSSMRVARVPSSRSRSRRSRRAVSARFSLRRRAASSCARRASRSAGRPRARWTRGAKEERERRESSLHRASRGRYTALTEELTSPSRDSAPGSSPKSRGDDPRASSSRS